MFNKAKSILVLILAFWVLVVSTGFLVNVKYCQKQLNEWSLIASIEDCHSDNLMMEDCCSVEKNHCDKSNVDIDCCDFDSKYVHLDIPFSFDIKKVELMPFIYVKSIQTIQIPIVSTFIKLNYNTSNQKCFYPPPENTINILNQQFLI